MLFLYFVVVIILLVVFVVAVAFVVMLLLSFSPKLKKKLTKLPKKAKKKSGTLPGFEPVIICFRGPSSKPNERHNRCAIEFLDIRMKTNIHIHSQLKLNRPRGVCC